MTSSPSKINVPSLKVELFSANPSIEFHITILPRRFEKYPEFCQKWLTFWSKCKLYVNIQSRVLSFQYFSDVFVCYFSGATFGPSAPQWRHPSLPLLLRLAGLHSIIYWWLQAQLRYYLFSYHRPANRLEV